MGIIKSRQKNWIGHNLRNNSLQREIMEGWMEGKRGRPRQKLMDWMMEDRYGNSRKWHNIETSEVVGHFDLLGDRLPEEEHFVSSTHYYI